MKKTASVYIPHMGCPNDCIFCNQVKISGQKTLLDYEAMREGIMSSIATMNEDDIVEIAFFGGSFTAIEKEVQEIFPWVYLPLVLKQGLIDNMGREQETPLFSWFYFGRIQSIIGSIILSLSIGQYGI